MVTKFPLVDSWFQNHAVYRIYNIFKFSSLSQKVFLSSFGCNFWGFLSFWKIHHLPRSSFLGHEIKLSSNMSWCLTRFMFPWKIWCTLLLIVLLLILLPLCWVTPGFFFPSSSCLKACCETLHGTVQRTFHLQLIKLVILTGMFSVLEFCSCFRAAPIPSVVRWLCWTLGSYLPFSMVVKPQMSFIMILVLKIT